MKRLFIAIDIKPSEEMLDFFAFLKDEFSEEKIRWIDLENLHITLIFLGETPISKIPEISNILKNTSSNTDKFEIKISDLGMFGTIEKPRVLWLGIKNTNELLKLHSNLNEELKRIGFKTENRKFSPHLTLGRLYFFEDKKLIIKLLKKNKNCFFQKVEVSKIHLYESIFDENLSPKYEIIKSFDLKT